MQSLHNCGAGWWRVGVSAGSVRRVLVASGMQHHPCFHRALCPPLKGPFICYFPMLLSFPQKYWRECLAQSAPVSSDISTGIQFRWFWDVYGRLDKFKRKTWILLFWFSFFSGKTVWHMIRDFLLPLLVAFKCFSYAVAIKSTWRPKRRLQLGEIEKCGQGLKMRNAAHAFLYVLQTKTCVCVCVYRRRWIIDLWQVMRAHITEGDPSLPPPSISPLLLPLTLTPLLLSAATSLKFAPSDKISHRRGAAPRQPV